MDRIKSIQILNICITLMFIVLNSLSCTEKNPKYYLPLLDSEIEYDYDKMIDAQKDYPSDSNSYKYSQIIIKDEKEFLKKCKKINNDKSLIGEWRLINSNGDEISKHSFLFNNLISISEYKNEIVLDNWGNRSVLYVGSDNRYYIFSRGIGIIRMIKIQDNTLFVYIVQDKKWVLDPIHNEGEYYYKKVNSVESNLDFDMKDWFEKL